MGGFCGVVSKQDCVSDLFFGTDYHSHLGTHRGGMALLGPNGFQRSIHNIQNAPFRSKFEQDFGRFSGNVGIGVISDTDPQPLVMCSKLGTFAIVTVGLIANIEKLKKELSTAYGTCRRKSREVARYFSSPKAESSTPPETATDARLSF